MNEADFTAQVIAMAQLRGWVVAHFRPLRRANGTWETPCQGDAKGFPDLFMLRPGTGHRVAAELKVGNNKKTPEQNAWLWAFELCGIPSFTWTPADWNEIDGVLEHGAELGPVHSPEAVRKLEAEIMKALRCAA